MKTKKMKIFTRIFSILMICCFAFLCVGCVGDNPDDYPDDWDDSGYEDGSGDFFESMALDMYGAKVLYRPDSYDFNTGSGAETGETNDYYGEYAWNIMNELVQTYGLADSATISNISNFNSDNIPYLYDSIRYKVDFWGTVNKTKTVDANGTVTSTEDLGNLQYLFIQADTTQSWNWSFDYDLKGNSANSPLLQVNSDQENLCWINGSRIYSTVYSSKKDINDAYVLNQDFKDTYTQIYLGANDAEDKANYSDYVKALQYVIYCYALDLEPGEVQVSINDDVADSNSDYYTVTVIENSTTKTIDKALEDAIARFNKLGSYVGLIQRQIDKIGAWIKTNVIGWQTKIMNDNIHIYDSVTEVITTDASGNETTTYEYETVAPTVVGRNYDSAVDKILQSVCSKVTIGKDGGEGVTINNRFLASEVKEYAGNTFFIEGDANFPKYEEGQSSVAIQPLEYQSVQLMLKKKVNVTDIWVALKYDADLDGTEKGVWGEKYLDIVVELNYFSHEKQKLFKVDSQTTRVYDGPYSFGGSFPSGFPSDHGTVFFNGFDETCLDSDFQSLLIKDAIPVGEYNTNIGNGILKTDVGISGYMGIPLVSKNPLVLVGTNSIRNYYSIIEPESDETLNGQTYITGRANENMYKGSDGCDYLELTYKVLKKPGDTTTNYKFYTGIAFACSDGNS